MCIRDRLKRIELTQKALDHENRVRENIMVIEEAMHECLSKEEFNMMLGFLAVSYTHLDVYKRQVQ